MYVPESKPKLYLEGMEIDNLSPDKNVFFMEEGHKYFHKDDIKDGKVSKFDDSVYKFKSPTGILGNFHEYFDAIPISERYVIKHGLDITAEELRAEWDEKARVASERGSMLHSLGESIIDGWDFGKLPDLPQVGHLLDVLEVVAAKGWIKAKVELLVYNTGFRVAGQADIVLKREKANGEMEYGIFDYKFLKEPIQKKSFFNPRTRQYKKMYGPFRHLPDSNYYHYSIQLEFYRMLMGKLGNKVVTKQLIVVTEEEYSLEECYPITLWVDTEGYLQARYKMFNGKIFNSSMDKEYMDEPFKII